MKTPSFSFFSLLTVVVGGAGGTCWWLVRGDSGNLEAAALPENAASKVVKMSMIAGARPQSAETRRESLEGEWVDAGIPSSVSPVTLPDPVPLGGGLVQIPQPVSEQELITRAAQVEQEANHDLARLVNLLDLSDTQQDRIFDSLARNAPSWHPAMQTVGVIVPPEGTAEIPSSPVPDPTVPGTPAETGKPEARKDLLDVIGTELTPDQQILLANAELDRREWWEEIIPKLLPPEEIPSIIGKDTAGPLPAVDKIQEEPGVLPE